MKRLESSAPTPSLQVLDERLPAVFLERPNKYLGIVELNGRYGVMGTPALVINSEVKAVGSVPPKAKLKNWIEQTAKQKNK